MKSTINSINQSINEYNQLNINTVYDFLNSTINIENYINVLKNKKIFNASWIGNGNFFGLQKFFINCQKNGLKPIVGLRFKLQIEKHIYNVVSFAKNITGYQSLLQLIPQIYGDKVLNLKNLQLLKECLLVFCYQNITDGPTFIELKQNHYWKKNFFIGCANAPSVKVRENFLNSIIPFNVVRYLHSDEKLKYSTLLAIKKQLKIQNVSTDYDYSWKDFHQLKKLFPNSQMWKNLTHFISQINLENIVNISIHMKSYPLKSSLNKTDYLWNICFQQLTKKFSNDAVYLQRLKYEFQIFVKQKWIDYLLIVRDYIQYARQKNILVGPGRGSACGSLVCYLLDITGIDPIKYDLIFERFLNPKLVQKPDIDTDFEDLKRRQIIEYLFSKYGNHHLAQITTFQTIGMRMAIRDVGRVNDIPLFELDQICKAIEPEFTSFTEAIAKKTILKKYHQKYSQLFELAAQIINFPRQNSVHPAGIIFVEEQIFTKLPCFVDEKHLTITQLDMYDIKACGIVKMDLLGLRNLSLIQEIIVQINHNNPKPIGVFRIPLNDPKTYQTLKNGQTLGIFQLESAGIKAVIKNLYPEKLEDIALALSLYRPGPLNNLKLFLDRKYEKAPIDYWLDEFKSILISTYGIPVFQEQIIMLVKKFADFNLSDAAQLQRAISKKNFNLIIALKEQFWIQSQKLGRSSLLIEKIWTIIIKFCGYGFNRSHAIAYSMITYWMAYLKTNYKQYFFTALLNKNLHDSNKNTLIFQHLNQTKNFQAVVSINRSTDQYFWDVKTNTILVPFNVIKRIRQTYTNSILHERKTNGLFKNLINFLRRMLQHNFSKLVFKQLIAADAFAEFGFNRNTLLKHFEKILLVAETSVPSPIGKKVDINLLPLIQLKKQPDDWKINLKCELNSFGFLINYDFIRKWQLEINMPSNQFKQIDQLSNITANELQINYFILFIYQIKIFRTKQGAEYARLKVFDATGITQIIVFNQNWKLYGTKLKKMSLVMCYLGSNYYQNRINYFLNTVVKINSILEFE